ncbi:MAG: alpha/beta fold hydrolase [Gemmataceae bacterium]
MIRPLAPLAVVCLSVLPFVTPAAQADGRVEKDVVYGKGGDVELKLDLALPATGDGPFPAVVCIHGGGWRQGSRQDLAKTIEILAGRGYVAATISYRLAPASRFPAQIEDCKAAVRWLRANSRKYRIHPDRIGVVGLSAGGHLACLLGVTSKEDGLEGNGGHPEQSSRVQAVVSFFGVTDFTNKDWTNDIDQQFVVPFLGGSLTDKAEVYRRASPITYVSRDDPPFLLFHGSEDSIVPIRHSKVLAAKLQGVGVPARLVTLEGEGHGWRGDKLLDTIQQTLNFLDERLKK